MSEPIPQRRVGDRERRVVDDQLLAAVGDGVLTLAEYDERAAALWRARTRDELDLLVADLPATQRPASALVLPGQPPAPRTVVAVLSQDRLEAAILPGQEVRGWAVLGSARLDLRRADLPDEVHVRVRSVLGEVEVLVPTGTTVHLSGASVLGDRQVQIDGTGGGPVVYLDAVAVLGAVNVSHGTGQPTPAASTHTGLARNNKNRAGRIASTIGSAAVTLALLAGVGGVIASGTDERVVFGSATQTVRAGDSPVEVSLLFGSITVVVANDVRIDRGGLVVFGSARCNAACASGSGSVVELRAVGGFGSVEIMTQDEYNAQPGLDPDERLELG